MKRTLIDFKSAITMHMIIKYTFVELNLATHQHN